MIEEENIVEGQMVDADQGQGQELIVLDDRRGRERWQNIDARGQGQQLRAAIEKVEKWVNNLEQDYKIRHTDQWQMILDNVVSLRDELRKEHNYIYIQSTHILKTCDDIGIAITSHIETCANTSEDNLRKRHKILERLRYLVEGAQKIERQVEKRG